MPAPEKGELSRAILHYLSSVGVRVRPWKLSPCQEKPRSVPARGLFGAPLHSLPLSAQAKGVPQFLVDACELLRLHLHVEGLFRKSGSVIRIKALKTRLEAGENCLHMALPCDVATLVKQFLRELPEPLVPAELQGPMCQVQQRLEKDRSPLTLLLTCLLPQPSASTLRYFFSFLWDVAVRCAQNKMDLANLAVVFAPNLFPSEHRGKLDGEAEELLQMQAAVVELLIRHASEIGTVPQTLLGKVQAASSDTGRKRQSPPKTGDRTGDEIAGSSRHWRRRSVGDIVTEALSKFKSGRALRAAPCPETEEGACRGGECQSSTTLRTSFHSKRKASDDIVWTSELSIKKRRSDLDSCGSDSSKEDVFEYPVDAGLVQGPGSLALVFSNSVSNPVSGTGSGSGSSRISTMKVQRRRSSSRKRLQRKHSIRTASTCSPTSLERKDTGRKSLRIFFRGSKDTHPLCPPIQMAEPSGWLLMKKVVTETLEGPTSQQRWARLPLQEPKETKDGQLSDEDSPPHTDRASQDAVENCKTGPGLNPGSDGVSSEHQELGLNALGGNGDSLGQRKGLLGNPSEAVVSPPQQLQLLRRSLSWPEGLSARGTAERVGTVFPQDEAPIDPGDRCGLAWPAQPDVEVIATDLRQQGVPTVCVTLADSCGAACPQNGPCDVTDSSKPDLPENYSAWADGLRHLSKVPQSSLKHFTLNFHRTPSQPNEGLNVARPKRKGGRRFGRSVSHESGLPLQAGEEASCAAKKGSTTKSPLKSFKAYGRQIFLTHKHLAMTFVGLRGRKESASPSPQETEWTTTDSQEALLRHQLVGERRRYRRSPKSPLVETQLVTSRDSQDL